MFAKSSDTETEDEIAYEVSEPSKKKKRPLLVRLFSIKFWGAVRLTLLCVVVGLIQRFGKAAQEPKETTILNTIAEIWEHTFAGLIWMVQHGWQPALIGATIVLPVWIIWRLISLPFRR